tara:strand:- start:438 stop:833 length:396 start_codon:yes stop_codon:yes gene_type:complete
MTEKNKGGRPTKYSQEMLDKAKDYVDNHEEYEDVVPTAVGLAFMLGISNSTLELWGTKHPEFSGTLERIQQKQHKGLISGGLTGDFTPTISKLMLSNHGHVEMTHNQNQQLDKDGQPADNSLKVEFVGVKK